jgi:ATP-dependent protease HslVU (ClpYQ) ATPase subunit
METVLTDFMFDAADSKSKRLTVDRACVEKALGKWPASRGEKKAS